MVVFPAFLYQVPDYSMAIENLKKTKSKKNKSQNIFAFLYTFNSFENRPTL